MTKTAIVRRGNNVWMVCADLNVQSVSQVLPQARQLIHQEDKLQVIDLSGVKQIDSAGLALLVELLRVARQRGRKIRFANIPGHMRAVAEVFGLSELLPDESFQAPRPAPA